MELLLAVVDVLWCLWNVLLIVAAVDVLWCLWDVLWIVAAVDVVFVGCFVDCSRC